MEVFAHMKESAFDSALLPSSRHAKGLAAEGLGADRRATSASRKQSSKVVQDIFNTVQAPTSAFRILQEMGKVTKHMEGLDGLHSFATSPTAEEGRCSRRYVHVAFKSHMTVFEQLTMFELERLHFAAFLEKKDSK